MTKASVTRVKSKAAKQRIAEEAIKIACHGRMITVNVDGQDITMWAMPSSAHQVVVSALTALAK